MRCFQAFVFVVSLVVIIFCVIPNDNNAEPLQELLLSFDQNSLQSRYGSERALNHSGTRSVYHQVLSEAEDMIQASRHTNEQKALTCSLMRFEARRYARSRDATHRGHMTEIALQLRDSYVHGLKHIPLALRKDLHDSLALQKPTLYHLALVIKQTINCLAPAITGGECPSYTFLREIRGKSDEEILGSCTRANRAFDMP